ncbi:hypothetical protein ACFSGX_17385 [Sphingomonas arantia]|uniref:Fe2OG dioxygenase domain-containing protein n=1 Tax=Sphingomonas arantia TaxID=1460676 RepID=A0ABW4U399_9SPHN
MARLRDLPARTALRLMNLGPVRRMMGPRYDAAVDAFRPQRPRLHGIDAQVVAGLERDGIAMVSIAALGLPGSDAMLARATELADAHADEAHRQVAAGAVFNVVPAAQMMTAPELFTWGLSDRLLDIAETYIGLPAAYDGVCINYTVADGREVSTRKWHRDWEDRRMLKVAVYLNDVDGEGGPFEMIARSDSCQNDAGGFRYALSSDRELVELLGPDYAADIVSCVGPAGTVVFTDTARFFHRGRPAVARDRKAIFYSYFAQRPRHPFLCERTGLSRRDIRRLSVGLPPRQLASALWWRQVPLLLRMIPPARI